MKKTITKTVTVLIFITIGWFIARLVYKYCDKTAFWVGFLSCFIGIIITCGIFVSIRTATVQLGVNRFFMDLQTRRRHQNVINKNKAAIILLLFGLVSCASPYRMDEAGNMVPSVYISSVNGHD